MFPYLFFESDSPFKSFQKSRQNCINPLLTNQVLKTFFDESSYRGALWSLNSSAGRAPLSLCHVRHFLNLGANAALRRFFG